MNFGVLGLNELSVIERCPCNREFRKESFNCINSSKRFGDGSRC